MFNRLKNLSKLNKKFCTGAGELRWERNGVWTKNWPNEIGWNVEKVPWYRSISYQNPHRYLLVADIDAFGVDEHSLRWARDIASQVQQMASTSVLIKASGQKGIHIILPIEFPKNFTERHIFEKMRDIIWTTFKDAGLEKEKIDIGRVLPPPCVDLHMFERGRLIRGYCFHNKSKLYSVPILETDDVNAIQRRMRLLEDVPEDIKIELCHYNPKWELEHLDIKEDYSRSSVSFEKIDPIRFGKMNKRRGVGDVIYRRLTPQLQTITNMDTDIHHSLKVPLVQYLRVVCLLSKGQIHKWLNKNVRWDDYDPNSRETRYQINHIVNWSDDRMAEKAFKEPQQEILPIRKEFIGEVWERNEYENYYSWK